jgi:pimeloyl-ACP methyl ester carboxylesterase
MSFLAQPVMASLSESFCWYHIDIPGQEPDADQLPDDYTFPTMTQLSEQVEYMADHFQLASLIGFGVGCGADILARYAMLCPSRVRGLILVNPSLQGSDWISPTWLFSKLAVWLMKGRQMEDGVPPLALSSLLNHSLGPGASGEAARIFRDSVSCQDPHNLSLLLHSFLSRSTIATEFALAARCDCLLVVSGNFQGKTELVNLVSQMEINRATLLEVPSTSGLVLLEEPGKVATALCYFLQGLGLIPTHSSPLLHPSPLLSLQTPPLPLQSAA